MVVVEDELATRRAESALLQAAKNEAAKRADALIDLRGARQRRVDIGYLEDGPAKETAKIEAGIEIQQGVQAAFSAIGELPAELSISGSGGHFVVDTKSGDLFSVTTVRQEPKKTLVDSAGWLTHSYRVLGGIRSHLIDLAVNGSIELPQVPEPVAPGGPV